MEMNVSHELNELETRWRTREQEWRRKLGRLRLGVEPLDEQLARYRRVTWALTAVPAIIAVMFLGLFTAFGRPDIGALVVVILFGPDHRLLVARFQEAGTPGECLSCRAGSVRERTDSG